MGFQAMKIDVIRDRGQGICLCLHMPLPEKSIVTRRKLVTVSFAIKSFGNPSHHGSRCLALRGDKAAADDRYHHRLSWVVSYSSKPFALLLVDRIN